MIKRYIEPTIVNHLNKGKAVLIYGARQVGKTTLIKAITSTLRQKVLILNGDEPDVKAMLSDYSSGRLKMLFGNAELVVIDEAQNINEIGRVLKVIVDYLPQFQVIATGSSSFELLNRVNEPLTGRKYEFTLSPIAFHEMANHHGLLEEVRLVEHRMVFGYYPEIVTSPGNEEKLLKLLAGSYLYKDLLMLEQIKRPKLIEKILKALALQVGSEVSYNEIAQLVGADSTTVEKYIEIMEQAFIIFRLPALSRNVRNEIRKGKKIYFNDNGIRNAVLGNFLPLYSRSDVGALWENYLVSERRKILIADDKQVNTYFWRTTQQQEIDYIEERGEQLFAYEFKWKSPARFKFSQTFTRSYSNANTQIVDKENFFEFLVQ